MRTLSPSTCAAMSIILAVTPSARAEIQPSFQLDLYAWNASHIVLATEGKKIDGLLEVLESWKGDCRPGEKLIIPELAAFEAEASRVVAKGLFDRDNDAKRPTHVTGSKMILFLCRSHSPDRKNDPPSARWISALGVYGLEGYGLKVSVVWIERGHAYAFQQENNPGPCQLVALGGRLGRPETEQELKAHVRKVTDHWAQIEKAKSLTDLDERVKILVPLTETASYLVNQRAVEALGTCGHKAIPQLRRLLQDEALVDFYHHFAKALSQTGKAHAGSALTEILAEELAFWHKTAPTLQEGWYYGRGIKDERATKSVQVHFRRLGPILDALKTVEFTGAQDVVAAVRGVLHKIPVIPKNESMLESSMRWYRELTETILRDLRK